MLERSGLLQVPPSKQRLNLYYVGSNGRKYIYSPNQGHLEGLPTSIIRYHIRLYDFERI